MEMPLHSRLVKELVGLSSVKLARYSTGNCNFMHSFAKKQELLSFGKVWSVMNGIFKIPRDARIFTEPHQTAISCLKKTAWHLWELV